ncbi:MAG: sensor histidine kinase [Planctomycetota bacterium]
MFTELWIWAGSCLFVGLAAGILIHNAVARRRLGKAHEEAEAAHRQKLEERAALMNTIATGLAHEIRNPLSALRMNIQLLREEWQNPITEREKQGVKKIDTLLRETGRVQRVLDDFLHFAAGHRLRREEVDLNHLLDDLASFLEARAEKGKVRFAKDFDESLPPVQADPNLLRQALMNLLINAEEAMPDGGTVTIRTRTAGPRARIEVRDTGAGIPADVRGRIFDIYYSTKPAGTGLGLPIARKITEEHGGTLSIGSPEGGGTAVTVEIPRNESP